MPSRDEMLETGMTQHRAGRLAEAEATYRAMLGSDPNDADALHLLGVVEDAKGAPARAVELIGRALEIRASPRFLSNLGMALGHLDRHEEALLAYQRALQLRPDYPEALNNLGTTLEALGRPAEALVCFQNALKLQPDRAEWWSNVGNVLLLLRRHEEAEAAYRQAVALSPALPRLHGDLGRALRRQGRPAEAEAAFRTQLALDPTDPNAHLNLAASLGEQDRPAEAVQALPAALALAPERPEAHHNLSTALRQLGQLEEAEQAARRALALRPDYHDALGILGLVLREQGQLGEAERVLRQALAQRPAEIANYNSLAVTLVDAGRMHEALAVLDLAIALAPMDPGMRLHRAFVLLLLGRLAEGWPDYEARLDTTQGRLDQRHFAQPRWRGEALNGRTILLTAEQGSGDTLQFCRYAKLVADCGGRVVMEVQPPLRRLLQSLAGVDTLVAQGEALPPFDVHAPLLSLPHLFGTEISSIPTCGPYLSPPAKTLAAWEQRLPRSDRPRIGLAWAGNPRHVNDRRRSMNFAALEPLWALPDIAWASLQVGPRSADLATAPPGLIEDLSPALSDFAETAAAIQQLDAVITVDSAVCHLAGALGKPTHLLLPFAPDWRWLRKRADTPWYPRLRLHRQDETRDWRALMEQLAHVLRDSLASPDAE
jgi:Flp pilus assembly protein TadD